MALKPTDDFVLTKSIWTDVDFEQMGWHDVHIRALAFDPDGFELLLDIDYMFAWVDPEPPDRYFTFWLAPCTLVFHNLADFRADIQSDIGDLEIYQINRSEMPSSPDQTGPVIYSPQWVLDLQEGEISFQATGFTQYTRAIPVRAAKQFFSLAERGGISFDRPAR